MKDNLLLIVLILCIPLSALSQGSKKFAAPQFALSYEGSSVDINEAIYIPKDGKFRLDLSNMNDLKKQLPEDAYITFVGSEVVLYRKDQEVQRNKYTVAEFLNQEVDLMPLLSKAKANDALALRIKYMYVLSREGKTKILEEGKSEMNIALK